MNKNKIIINQTSLGPEVSVQRPESGPGVGTQWFNVDVCLTSADDPGPAADDSLGCNCQLQLLPCGSFMS